MLTTRGGGIIFVAAKKKDNILKINHFHLNVEIFHMRLSDMKAGQTGVISHVGGNGVLRRRILEMGILKGAEVYIEKYAPLRDPLELIVKGYHVSLRVEEAAQIMVDNVT